MEKIIYLHSKNIGYLFLESRPEEDFELVSIGEETVKLVIPMIQDKKEIKQETLGEAAKRIVLETYGEIFSKHPRGGKLSNETIINILTVFFRLGSEWQQEQDKNLYTEEDLREAFIAGGNSQIEEDDQYGTEYDAYMEEWFEQYKKK